MYSRAKVGELELIGIDSEWHARKHDYQRLDNNWSLLAFWMEHEPKQEGALKLKPIYFPFLVGSTTPINWDSVRTQVFFKLQRVKKHFKRFSRISANLS